MTVKSQTLGKEIEQSLEHAIVEKKFLPGEKLPSEVELCRQYGVSRTSVREALKMLSSRGLVTIRKGSGIYVNDFSITHAVAPINLFFRLNFNRENLIHLIKTRQVIEPEVAALCAKNRTESVLRILNKNLNAFRDRMQSPAALATLDVEFHSTIAKGCGNPVLSLLLQPLFDQLPYIKTLVVEHIRDKKDTAYNFHTSIYQAILDRNAEGARNAMVEHLNVAYDDTLRLAQALFVTSQK